MHAPHSRDGSFDTLRLIAALAVFHSHSFAIVGLPEPALPGYSLGGVAVVMFFAMSGYWVTRSALQRSVASFAVARVLRIVPGLFVCCLVTIFLCALATSEVVNDYLQNLETWRWLQNAAPFWLPQRGALPGVFEDGAIANPNGSLWTLPYEVLCYLLAALVAVLGGKRGMFIATLAAGIFAAAVICGGQADTTLQLASPLNLRWLALFAAAFFLGAGLNMASNTRLLTLAGACGFALLFADRHLAIPLLAGIGLFSALAIWIGRNVNLDRRLTRGQDISYGLYIYAFPLTQLAARAIEPNDPLEFAVYWSAALAATLVLAWLSWTFVEKPALGLKGALTAAIEGRARQSPVLVRRAEA